MFSIVTTQKIIEKLYPEDSVWGNIVAQTKCFYVKLDSNWWEEDDKPLSDLYRNGAKIIDSADLFEDLDKHPEVIANYPTSVFILDIEEKEARQLQQKYGVIIQSFSNLDDAILTAVSKKTIFTEEGETGIGWPEVLAGVRNLPANAIIINDRNLFTNDEILVDKAGNPLEKKLNGVDNVYNILNTLLPRTLDVPFHVLIVCEKAGIENHLTVKIVGSYLTKVRNQLSRPYHIAMELLAISRDSALFSDSHNRRVLTNYGLLTFEHKVNAFEGRTSRSTQMITVNKLFSHDDIREISPFEKNHRRIIKDLKEYAAYVKDNPKLAEHEFYKSGYAGLKFDQTEHRMIIK